MMMWCCISKEPGVIYATFDFYFSVIKNNKEGAAHLEIYSRPGAVTRDYLFLLLWRRAEHSRSHLGNE